MKTRLHACFLLLIVAWLNGNGQTPTLWGMTNSGGEYNAGSIFAYDIASNSYQQVFSLFDAQGSYPIGALTMGNNGLLYGLTKEGGTCNAGVLFSYNMQSRVYTVLHSFGCDTDGFYPGASLYLANNGILYGVANNGGAFYGGIIFSYDIATNNYARFYSFNGVEGAVPVGNFITGDGNLLYATASSGGANNAGTIFTFNITTGAVNAIYSFTDSAYESQPSDNMVMVGDSLLYGSVFSGAFQTYGYMFCYNMRTGNYTHVRSFDNPGTGYEGAGPLLKGRDGLIYGVASAGGVFDTLGSRGGLLFSYSTPNDSESVLHYFGNGDDGAFPVSSLMQAGNGLIYGTTHEGGHFSDGVIFSYDLSSGIYSVLYQFSGQPDGQYAWGPMIEVGLSTGIQPTTADSKLQIWPNPTTGQFRVQLPDNTTGCEVEVFNVMGQKVTRQPITVALCNINLTNQPAGMYFVYLNTASGTFTGKVSLVK